MNNPTKVIISAYNRNLDLLPLTLLVFKTIRVGFPNAQIIVIDDGDNSQLVRSEIRDACKSVGAQHKPIASHHLYHQLIEALTEGAINDNGAEPFWFCDTDVIFWDSMEQWKFNTALAGRWIPSFNDPFTKCNTYHRLHPSLLRVDPKRLKRALDAYRSGYPQTPINPMANLYAPIHIPVQDTFYDVCALLCHVANGYGEITRFNSPHLDCYDHLNCGQWVDIIGPAISADGKMQDRLLAYAANPESARGLWRKQDEWFKAHSLQS
jgi:hypothetical protein